MHSLGLTSPFQALQRFAMSAAWLVAAGAAVVLEHRLRRCWVGAAITTGTSCKFPSRFSAVTTNFSMALEGDCANADILMAAANKLLEAKRMCLHVIVRPRKAFVVAGPKRFDRRQLLGTVRRGNDMAPAPSSQAGFNPQRHLVWGNRNTSPSQALSHSRL